jgi:CheY-like chemotaxis protein
MYGQFGQDLPGDAFERSDTAMAVAQSGQLDALVALERIGAHRSFTRDEEICAEGDASDSWYRVISGAVRLIVDQHMPGMDGLEIVTALHRQAVFVPTVLDHRPPR